MSLLLLHPRTRPSRPGPERLHRALDSWWRSVDRYEHAPGEAARRAAAARMRAARVEVTSALEVDSEPLDDELAAFAACPATAPTLPPPG